MPGIELVVFDMDGVLVDLDRARRLEFLSAMTGLAPETIAERIYLSTFETAAEAGAHPTGDRYLAEFNRLLGSAISRDQWVSARRRAMTPNRRVLGIAEAVAATIPIALLTNNGSLVQEALAELAPEVARTFGTSAHTSSRFAARKPDPVVFERLVTHHGVAPAATVFVDDDRDSVSGAVRAGLIGIHFTSAEALARELRQLGIDVPDPEPEA
jgi:glucose-1-phosphatase